MCNLKRQHFVCNDSGVERGEDCEPLAEGCYPSATASPKRVGLCWGGVNNAGCSFISSLILSFLLSLSPPLTQSLNDSLPNHSSAADASAPNTGEAWEWGLAPSLAVQKRQILLPPPAAPPLKYLQTSPYSCILPPHFLRPTKSIPGAAFSQPIGVRVQLRVSLSLPLPPSLLCLLWLKKNNPTSSCRRWGLEGFWILRGPPSLPSSAKVALCKQGGREGGRGEARR